MTSPIASIAPSHASSWRPDAGADVLYPVGRHDDATQRRLTSELPLPINAIGIPDQDDPASFGPLGVAQCELRSVSSRWHWPTVRTRSWDAGSKNADTDVARPALDDRGHLVETGWAPSEIRKYRRSAITAPKFRIKEWDYYCVLTADYGIALTVADNVVHGLARSLLARFPTPHEITENVMLPFPMGRLGLPEKRRRR